MDSLETQSSSTASGHSMISYKKSDYSHGIQQQRESKRYRDTLTLPDQRRHKRIRAQSSQSNPRYLCVPQWCQKNPHFTGRKTLIESIREKLCDSASEQYTHRLAIYGMGGVGKTQIAIEYVMTFENEYVGIYWITASSEAELLSGFQAIANETRCVNTESLTLSEIARQVLNWLYRSENWLLVLDNLDDITIAEGYLPRIRIGGGHVLITTRNPNSLNIPAEGMQIDVHEPDEAKDLLLRRTQMLDEIGTGSKVEHEAKAIVKVLGYLALAIEQAAAYIREDLKDIFKFCAIYAAQRSQFHYRQSICNSYYKNTIATTWLMSMEAVESRNPQAGQLLRLLAFMNPDGTSLGFLEDGRHGFPDNFKSGTQTAFSANLRKALGDLEQFSLIFRPKPELILVHRMVQAVTKDRLLNNELNAYRIIVCDIGLLAFPEFAYENLLKCRAYQWQISSIVAEIKDMGNGAAAKLLRRVGTFLVRDGKARDGESLFAMAFSFAREILGEEHPDTLLTMDDLAWSYQSLGRTKEAAEMQEKVLEVRRRILGEEHPSTLGTMDNLASSYLSLGRTKEAAQMQENVLEVSRRILGEEHLDTLGTMDNLASSYQSLGRTKEAAQMQENVLEVRRRILGEEHPDTLRTMDNLAWSYQSLGRTKEAAQMRENVLEVRRRILGEEHPDTLRTMDNLAWSYQSLGRTKEAAQMQENVLEVSRRILGEEHPDTLGTMHNLAWSYQSLGRTKEAAQMQENVLEVRRRILGEEHPVHTGDDAQPRVVISVTGSDEGGGSNAGECVGSEPEDPGGGASGHAGDDAQPRVVISVTGSDEGGGSNAGECVGSEPEDPGGGASVHAADDAQPRVVISVTGSDEGGGSNAGECVGSEPEDPGGEASVHAADDGQPRVVISVTGSDEGGGSNAGECVGSEPEDPGGGASGHAGDDGQPRVVISVTGSDEGGG